MAALQKLQNFCGKFIDFLVNSRSYLMPLEIPQMPFDLDSITELEYEDREEVSITRNFDNYSSQKKYSQVFAVAALVMELILTRRTISLRDVYYTLKYIFATQEECNACIIDLGLILNLKRHEMNIIPAAKGLVAGNMRYQFPNNNASSENNKRKNQRFNATLSSTTFVRRRQRRRSAVASIDNDDVDDEKNNQRQVEIPWCDVQAATEEGGVSISSYWTKCCLHYRRQQNGGGGNNNSSTTSSSQRNNSYTDNDDDDEEGADDENVSTNQQPPQVEIEIEKNTKALIIIEKQGIFQQLCKDKFHKRYSCVLVCGCGFPDIATRAFVSHFTTCFPKLLVVGLCDYNPYGLALLLTYRFQSEGKSRYESTGYQTSGLKWLGLRHHHLQQLAVLSNKNNSGSNNDGNNKAGRDIVGGDGNDNTVVSCDTSSATSSSSSSMSLDDGSSSGCNFLSQSLLPSSYISQNQSGGYYSNNVDTYNSSSYDSYNNMNDHNYSDDSNIGSSSSQYSSTTTTHSHSVISSTHTHSGTTATHGHSHKMKIAVKDVVFQTLTAADKRKIDCMLRSDIFTNNNASGSNSSNYSLGSSQSQHQPFSRHLLSSSSLSQSSSLPSQFSITHAYSQPHPHHHLSEDYTFELQAMLTGGVKCELEALNTLGLGRLSDYVYDALVSRDYI